MNIGNLKEKKKKFKPDKHLYLSGVYRLLDKLINVKAFILQEFGMELMPSSYLSQTLSKLIFRNSFFFPFLVYNIHLEQKKENYKKNLISLLFPKFFKKFINKSSRKLLFHEDTIININRIVEFSHALCLDIKEAKYNKCKMKIIGVSLFNLWEKDCKEKDIIENINSKLNELWTYFRNATYFKSSEFNIELVRKLAIEIDLFFPEVNLYEIISYNSKIISSLLTNKEKDKILTLFTEYFSKSSLYAPNNCHEFSIKLVNRHYREVDLKYFSMEKILDLKNLQIYPFLIFIGELINSKPVKYQDMDDLRILTVEKLSSVFPNKNICLGSYGKTINFDIFFDPYNKNNYHKKQRCKNECLMQDECEIERDGRFLFEKERPCPYDEYISFEHEEAEKEAYDYYHQREEDSYHEIMEDERKYNQRKKEIIGILHQSITISLIKEKYKKALRLIKKKILNFDLEINCNIVNILERNFKNKDIRMIIILILTKSHFNAENREPITYLKYYKLLKKLILEYTNNNKEKIIDYIINQFISILRKKKIRNFAKYIIEELNEIIIILIEYIIKYPKFNDHWCRLNKYFARLISIVDNPLKIKIRSLLREEFKFIENVKTNQKNYLLRLFKNKDIEIVRIIKNLN